jgi:hypothetical protein
MNRATIGDFSDVHPLEMTVLIFLKWLLVNNTIG